MKKIGILIAILLLAVGTVTAVNLEKPAREHKGVAEHLYLVQKDICWNIMEDGAWGKLMYQEDKFVFNGHKLVPGEGYTLISYKESNGVGSVELGTGTADEFGNVNIKGVMDSVINDYPSDSIGDYKGVSGAKIWLVPSYKLTVSPEGYVTMFNWGSYPAGVTEMLFETKLI